jgi:internalin A
MHLRQYRHNILIIDFGKDGRMRTGINLNIWLLLSFISIGILCSTNTILAEEPVYFVDANLKAAVEEDLDIANPTPTEMLMITELIVARKGISDLTGLEYARNLRYLNLNYNQISDLSRLSGLTSLENLRLYDNQIRDISPLSALMSLEELCLGENHVSDLSPLSGLTNMWFLDLRDNQIRDLSPLSGCANLEILWVSKNWIDDISVLHGLTRLRELGISNTHISDLSLLSGFTNLEFLSLSYNQISDISALSELVNLQVLYLDDNQISDISPLSGLTSLRELRLPKNQISDISALSGLTNMRYLDLNYNQVGDISPLSNCTDLQNLRIGYNQVGDISALYGLTNLKWMYLMHNQISDISPLSNLANLDQLNLGHNQISDISGVAGLINLKELRLGSNNISDISALSGLSTLHTLTIAYNQISDISPLSGLTNLEDLWLQHNPLNTDAYNIYIPMIQDYGTTVLYSGPEWFTLTISSTEGGSVVEPGEGDFSHTNLTIVNVNAVAEPGYRFVNWTGTAVDVGKVSNPDLANTTVTMEADYTLQANFEQIRLAIYVDDDAAGDPSEDGSQEHPYDTIQEAIDAAEEGDTILVYPGTYQEEIIFLGKAITVQGVAGTDGIPVLENPGDFAVSFYNSEGADSVLKNFIIKNSFIAVFIAGSSPTISNITVVDNTYGIETYAGSEPDISNSIFWNNTDDDLFQCEARFSCIERAVPGEGNINVNPLFVDPNNGDYHLRSQRGRYWSEYDVWILDSVTSPCIDGGDPTVDPLDEPKPNGDRINMGAYGGTAYASMSDTFVTVVEDEILPPEVVEQVRGITGGFWREDSPWFIAKFHNSSDYTITQITIRVRLTDRNTSEQQWYEVILGPPGAVIPPGETMVLTGDVGATRGDKDFYWEIAEMRGYKD